MTTTFAVDRGDHVIGVEADQWYVGERGELVFVKEATNTYACAPGTWGTVGIAVEKPDLNALIEAPKADEEPDHG